MTFRTKSLLWIVSACHFEISLAARPSREVLGVLNTEDHGSRVSAVHSNNHSQHSGSDGPDWCKLQKEKIERIYKSILPGFDSEGSHCNWPGITCYAFACTVLGIHLPDKDLSGELSLDAWTDLKYLETVDLSNTWVKGDISVFENLPSLQALNLANTEVEGDLSVLENLDSLHTVNFAHTKVEGDVSVFKNLDSLHTVNLAHTEVEGEISVFENLRTLRDVNLVDTRVTGDIRAFRPKKLGEEAMNLQILRLSFTAVTGNINVFESSETLKVLELYDTKVVGDIESLQADPDLPACALQEIDLQNTGVTGDIRAMQAFPELLSLNLAETLVFGDISAFEATPRLKFLSLYSAGAFGDINAFQRTPNLETLVLGLTQVSGDIQVFKNTPKLQSLHLDAAQVIGDIQVFEGVSGLMTLTMSSTTVTGDIAVFNSSEALFRIEVSDTGLFGNIDAFANLDMLGSLRMRNTQVQGNLADLQGVLLMELDLSSTGIEGDIGVFENTTSLQRVALSSTKVIGNVAVFGKSQDLSQLDLSLTDITGDIRVFKRRNLQTLRLASTGVSGSLGVLASGALFDEITILDLSDTKVQGNIFVLKHALDLKELYLGNTQVAGSIDGIVGWKMASVVDLSRTSVSGRLTEKWRGCCQHLRVLKLSGSRAPFVPSGTDLIKLMDLREETQNALLPALTTLEVSGCPLNGHVRDLVLPLAYCEHLASIMAVNCGLHGGFPNLDPLRPMRSGDILLSDQRSKLASSLEFLDLSGNNLTIIDSIPSYLRSFVISSNDKPLELAQGVLTSALKHGVSIDFRGSTLHNETRKEAQGLLRNRVIQRTQERTFSSHEKDGYSCYDLDRNSTTLQVLPPEFLPTELCDCLPGWYGKGASCRKCRADHFKSEQGEGECIPCKWGTTTNNQEGSTSNSSCLCKKAFERHEGGKKQGLVCECEKGSAIFDGHCLECFPPSERCRGGMVSGDHCGDGYHGPLCMRCKDQYYATGGSCERCKALGALRISPWVVKSLSIACVAALLIGFFVAIPFFVYSWNPSRWLEGRVKAAARAIFAPGNLGEWQQQLVKRQAPMLLQMCQLWGVLADLASRDDRVSESFWERPYMQYLQLVVGNMRGILSLQCFYDGKLVRQILAFIMPTAPLFLLLCCGCIEVFKRGSGVNAALKILTVFFVGGASKCAALISCQKVDAGGWALQDDMTFLRYLPDLGCRREIMVPPEVAAVFWPCAVCYAILIPCFLFYLYARQHMVLRYTRMPLDLLSGSQNQPLTVSHQDLTLQRRLVAGLVAYVSMLQHGSVRVQLRDGKGIVTFLNKPDGTAVELDAEAINAQFQIESEKLRHHAITEMLLERQTLEEVGEEDRFLLGAKETLLKYSTFRDLWIEVMLKLVTVAIVQAVASSTASSDMLVPLGKVLAATLTVAATVWTLRPYVQPQVNDLQVSCFLGLAFAATGFYLRTVAQPPGTADALGAGGPPAVAA